MKEVQIVGMFQPHKGPYQSEEVTCKYAVYSCTGCVRATVWRSDAIGMGCLDGKMGESKRGELCEINSGAVLGV